MSSLYESDECNDEGSLLPVPTSRLCPCRTCHSLHDAPAIAAPATPALTPRAHGTRATSLPSGRWYRTPAASPSFPLPTAHLTCKRYPTPIRRDICRCVLPLPLLLHGLTHPPFVPQTGLQCSAASANRIAFRKWRNDLSTRLLILIPYNLPLPPRLSRASTPSRPQKMYRFI